MNAIRMTLLVVLSAIVLCALFFVSWLVYMPVMALVAAPFILAGGALAGVAPSALLNSIAATILSAGLAYATVAAVLRILLRRARIRRRARLAA